MNGTKDITNGAAEDVSVASLEELEPGNYFPLPVGSDALRQIALLGVAASWATRRPFYIRQNGILSVMCGRMKDAREVYMDPERFTVVRPQRRGYEVFDMFGELESVLQMDGERHHRVRRLMNPSFSAASMEVLKADIQRILGEKLDQIETNGPEFDAMTDFSQDLVERVMLEASFKLSREQREIFLRMQHQMTRLSSFVPGDPIPQDFVEAAEAVQTVMYEIVEQRRANPGPDLISTLITAYEEGEKLTDAELFGQISSIVTAGIGTTANTLSAALLLLCRHPDQMALLLEKPELIDNAVEECLRYHGPGIVSFVRFATQDTDIGGTRILKDMPVYASPQAAGFDASEFEDPHQFDIRRKPKGTLVFGTGIHHCVGQRLARYVLKTAITAMITRFPALKLADPEFQPVYRGFTGELQAVSIPMRTR